MRRILITILLLLTFGFANAQKVSEVVNGDLRICDLDRNNYTSNCTTVSSSVKYADISDDRIAILYNVGKLKLCNVDNNNYTENCSTLESSGVSRVTLIGSLIIIEYTNGNKKRCNFDDNNYTNNCYHQ